VTNAKDLFEVASNSQIVISHVLTKLNAETEIYVERMLELLQSVTWDVRDDTEPAAVAAPISSAGRALLAGKPGDARAIGIALKVLDDPEVHRLCPLKPLARSSLF
jgi:hypothetical protein